MLKHFFTPQPLSKGQFSLEKDLGHRLTKVLRLAAGAEFALFNGRDGLWQAQLLDPKTLAVDCQALLRPQRAVQGPLLLLACLKRDAFETALRQATELGVRGIMPLSTDFTVKTEFNLARAQAIVIEAAEQCERLDLPEILPLQPLKPAVMAQQGVYWAAERVVTATWPATIDPMAGVLIGPEGGFSAAEKTWLNSQKNITPVSLGAQVLRADTAVVAALSQLLRP